MKYTWEDVDGNTNEKTSAVDSSVNYVIRQIKTGALKQGDKLPPEPELCKLINVSRSSVREGIKILDAFGIIDVKRGDGTYVASVDTATAWDPLILKFILLDPDDNEMLELRNALEDIIILLATRKADGEDIENLRTAHYAMKIAVDSDMKDLKKLVELDLEFHYAICAATHNRMLISIYHCVMAFFAPYILKGIAQLENYGRLSVQTHLLALRAIESHSESDAKLAAQNMVLTWKRVAFSDAE